MTPKEAIKWIKEQRSNYVSSDPYAISLDMAIEALEKQIPRKKHKYKGYRCICGKEVAKNQTYCEYCGQKLLDWSEEE